MSEDISKTTIVILLVLTVVISVIGTWTVLDSLGKVDQQLGESGAGGSQANLKLTLTKADNVPAKTDVDSSGGNIKLSIA